MGYVVRPHPDGCVVGARHRVPSLAMHASSINDSALQPDAACTADPTNTHIAPAQSPKAGMQHTLQTRKHTTCSQRCSLFSAIAWWMRTCPHQRTTRRIRRRAVDKHAGHTSTIPLRSNPARVNASVRKWSAESGQTTLMGSTWRWRRKQRQKSESSRAKDE